MNRGNNNPQENTSDKHEQKLVELRENVIEAIAESMGLYGITPSNAHLYGALLFSEKPMSLDEMGNALEMSKTSMSTGVRALMHLKMIDKIWLKGARKDHYTIGKDWHQNFIDYFDVEWRDIAKNCIRVLTRTLDELKSMKEQSHIEGIIKKIDTDIEKIQYALDYYGWLLRLIDFLKSNDIFEHVPKETEFKRSQ